MKCVECFIYFVIITIQWKTLIHGKPCHCYKYCYRQGPCYSEAVFDSFCGGLLRSMLRLLKSMLGCLPKSMSALMNLDIFLKDDFKNIWPCRHIFCTLACHYNFQD